MRPIEQGRSRSELPAIRVLYNAAEEVHIIKLMPRHQHEMAAMDFVMMFQENMACLGIDRASLRNIRAARFGALCARSKEPNAGLRPLTRVLATDWPFVVIKVGVVPLSTSYGLPHLAYPERRKNLNRHPPRCRKGYKGDDDRAIGGNSQNSTDTSLKSVL